MRKLIAALAVTLSLVAVAPAAGSPACGCDEFPKLPGCQVTTGMSDGGD